VEVKNLIFLGSSCVYPKNSKQPIKESYLLTGELEKTNDAYAIAKIAGLKCVKVTMNNIKQIINV
jgi:GDP-L-fucose synthase